MVSDVGDSEGVAGQTFTGVEVRAQLIKYLADSLRDLPGRVGGLQLLSRFRQPFLGTTRNRLRRLGRC